MNSPTNVSKFDNDFIISSELAFSFIKNKLNKESVTCGDTLLELFNFSENNTELLESSLIEVNHNIIEKLKMKVKEIKDEMDV